MAHFPKRLLHGLVVLALSLMPAPAFADPPAQHVASACDRGMFDLDCSCVVAEFESAAQGATGPERGTLASITGTMLGIEPDPALMDMSALMTVMDRVNALEDLTDTCAAQAVPASQMTEGMIDDQVRAACSRYPAQIDCGCVETTYQVAAIGTDLEQRQAVADLTIHNLNGAPPADMSRVAEINQLLRGHDAQIEPLNDVARNCAAAATPPTPAPASADLDLTAASRGDILQACRDSDMGLDCGCVGRRYSRISAGSDAEEQAGLARVAIAAVGGENRIAETPTPVLERIADRMGGLMTDALLDACPAPAETSTTPPGGQTAFVLSACQNSGLPLACQCVADGFRNASGALSDIDRAFVADALVTSLYETPQRPVSDYPPNRALANMDLVDRLTDGDAGLARSCTDTSAPNLVAARRAGERVAASGVSSPGGNGWREAVRADCESFGNSPGLCACQAEVMGQHLSGSERELMGMNYRTAGQDVNLAESPQFAGMSEAELRAMQRRVNDIMSSERIQFEADLVCHALR